MNASLHAVIDIGTNSTKLVVGRPASRGVHVVAMRRKTTRAGAGVGRSRNITRERIDATIDVVRRFARVANRYGAHRVVAFATYAFRRAGNGRQAASAIAHATDVPVHILSGREEARLAYVSARAIVNRPKHGMVIVDVGGGSSEVVIARGGRLLSGRSLPIGALHLTERYLRTDPIDPDEFAVLRARVDRTVGRALDGLGLRPSQFDLVLSGGTATTTTRMLDAHDDVVTSHAIKTLLDECLARTLARRRRMRGLPADRADIMPAGLAIVHAAMRATGKRVARVNHGGVREGFLLDIFADQAK